MSIPDEAFFAWLDGELPGDQAAEIEAKVAADPELSRLAGEHRAMQARLKRAFDSVAEAPVPERVAAQLRQPETNITPIAAAQPRSRAPGLPWWVAMAATLALGVFVGTAIPHRPGAPVEVSGGKIYAAAALDDALETELASAPSEGDVRIGLTFREASGSICRTFTDAAASGLACRDSGRWQLRGLFAAPEGQSGEYRMAAGMNPNLAALIDSTMTGEPFDAEQEKAAKARGWRS